MRPVPVYELYGERSTGRIPDVLHCESIALRSRAHRGQIRRHRHSGLCQIMFARSGRVTAEIETRTFTLEDGFLVLIPSLTVHGYSIDPATEGWVLTFPEQSMQPAFAVVSGVQQALTAPRVLIAAEAASEFEQIARQMETISAEFGSSYAGRRYLLQTELTTLLIRLGRHLATGAAGAVDMHSRKSLRVGRLLSLVESGFREHRPAAHYARELGMTSTHLNRICREVLGRSTTGVIHDRLIAEAKRNLVYTTMTVTEVAGVLGFSDVSYFSRFFQRKVGESPLKYRARQQQAIVARAPGAGPDGGRREGIGEPAWQ